MLGRSLGFFASLGLSLAASGCLLDAGPYQTDGAGAASTTSHQGGAGGQAGGATTGSETSESGGGGSGGATTGTGTATSTTPECDSQDDCLDDDPCTLDVCDVDICKHVMASPGTPVADVASTDCVQTVCDEHGDVVFGPDDDDIPVADDNQCDVESCAGGAVVHTVAADGGQCGVQPGGACKQSVCVAGQCKVQNKADGTPVPDDNTQDCALLACYMGAVYYYAHDELCPDGNPDNCIVPDCGVSPTGGTCYSMNAQSGKACIKSGGGGGTCNSSGMCF